MWYPVLLSEIGDKRLNFYIVWPVAMKIGTNLYFGQLFMVFLNVN